MPLYEYKCVECDERFEVEQSMKDATLKTIKGTDHTHKVKKVFSPVGISFKGSGFYKNDSAGKKSKPKQSGSETASSENSSSTEGTKSDGATSESATSASGSKAKDPAKKTSSAST